MIANFRQCAYVLSVATVVSLPGLKQTSAIEPVLSQAQACEQIRLAPCDSQEPQNLAQRVAAARVDEFPDTFVFHGYPLDDSADPSDSACDSGAVYVYRQNDGTWTLERKLTSPTPTCGEGFGLSVSALGKRLLVGAQTWFTIGATFSLGKAYVLEMTGPPDQLDWVVDAGGILVPPSNMPGDAFGFSVAVDGDLAVIGAPGEDGTFPRGKAEVFVRLDGGWAHQATVTPDPASRVCDRFPCDSFGKNVSLSGDWLAVSAFNDSQGRLWQGAVYVFERSDSGTPADPVDDTWIQRKKIREDGTPSDFHFGSSAAIDGDLLAIGAEQYANDRGAAYLYNLDGGEWLLDQVVTPLDASSEDGFGVSIGLQGSRMVVGNAADATVDVGGDLEPGGSVYLFERAAGCPRGNSCWSSSGEKLVARRPEGRRSVRLARPARRRSHRRQRITG